MQLSVSLLLIFIVCSGFKYWIIQCIILATATTLIEKMTQETFITNMHARIKKNISRKRSSYFSCCYCIFLKIFSHCIYIFLILNQQCPYSSPYPSFCLSISLSLLLSFQCLIVFPYPFPVGTASKSCYTILLLYRFTQFALKLLAL